jgi:hypothetical protein
MTLKHLVSLQVRVKSSVQADLDLHTVDRWEGREEKRKKFMALGENVWEQVSTRQWKGRGIDGGFSPRTGVSERIVLTHRADTRSDCARSLFPYGDKRAWDTCSWRVITRSLVGFWCESSCRGPLHSDSRWGLTRESILGSAHWWWEIWWGDVFG